MEFVEKGAVCPNDRVSKYDMDSKFRRKICCEKGSGPKIPNLPPICAPDCVMGADGQPQKWSITSYSPSYICKPEFEIFKLQTAEGEKCCCMALTTTSTTTSTTSTTASTSTSTSTSTTASTTHSTSSSTSTSTIPSTSSSTSSTSTTSTSASTTSTSTTSPSTTTSIILSTLTSTSDTTTTTVPSESTTPSLTSASTTSPTTLKAGETTKKPEPTPPSKPPNDEAPKAGVQCNYDKDRNIMKSLMEICSANIQCRANEKKVTDVFLGNEYCCCDLDKKLPPPSETDPKLIAPKCYFDRDGNVVPFSTLTTGLDLICPSSDNMLTYTDDKDPTSCCILKDMTTKATTTVAPGTRKRFL